MGHSQIQKGPLRVNRSGRSPDRLKMKNPARAAVKTGSRCVRTVPVLLCNNIPSLADLSHGMLRRLMVIPFDRIFTDIDKDPELFDRIVAHELPGVLNRALEGYRRLLVRGTFKLPTAVKIATTRWLQHANPLPAFIEACCIKQPEAECRLADFYAAYAEWARQMGYTLTQNQQTVSLDLQPLGFAATTTSRGTVFVCRALTDRDHHR